MTRKFDRNQPFSKVYGSSPAAYFQNAHYFSGDGTYLTWAQAAGEVELPTTAAETEIQSIEAAERITNREKADSRVQEESPIFDSRTVLSQPSSEVTAEVTNTPMPTGREDDVSSVDEVESSSTAETGITSKLMAAKLNAEGKTDAEIGDLMGVAKIAGSDWLDRTNGNTSNDHRVKVPKTEHAVIVRRLEAGETQAQVAVDYGISQKQISNIARYLRKNISIDVP